MIDYVIYQQLGLVISRWGERADDEQMLDTYTRIYKDPDWRPGMDEFADLRGADLAGVSTKGLQRLAWMSEENQADADEVPRSAVLVDRDVNYGLARMYDALAADSQETVRLFHDVQEAADWLGVPASALD